jgi:putative transcriptional regulator
MKRNGTGPGERSEASSLIITRRRSSVRPRQSRPSRSVRKRLGISQAEFSARYHVPIGTLRDWEQNRKQPDAPALAYLRVIAREPDMVARALRRAAA